MWKKYRVATDLLELLNITIYLPRLVIILAMYGVVNRACGFMPIMKR